MALHPWLALDAGAALEEIGENYREAVYRRLT